MLGAIIGDIVGSRFEWNNNKSKDFELLNYKCKFTDDTVMSLAIAKAILLSTNYDELKGNSIKFMQELGRKYSNCGYGARFSEWIVSDRPSAYNSFGNGAAMRVSACGFAAKNLEDAIFLAKKVTEVTHNHPEGLKGAEATSVAIYLAKSGKSILEIRDFINRNYYPMNFKLDDIRQSYKFNESCQGSVPQAIEAFLESKNFEDAIRNAVSIGGDSDTIAAITGSIAEAYYGIPNQIRKHALTFLDEELLSILLEFENKYPPFIEMGLKKIEIKTKNKNTFGRSEMIEKAVNNLDSDLSRSKSREEITSSQQLFHHLYGACNILRGPINQDEFKSYVTPILFFKRISDVYDEEAQDAVNKYGEEATLFEEQHSFIIPDGCHWNDVRNASVNIGKAIVDAMSGIERANPDTLSLVFSSFDDATWTDKTKLSDERLKNLVEHMSKIKVGNKNYSADVMGDAYEYLIKQFADESKKNAGEFYTPRSIVKLLVKLIDPKPGEEVYDPACGTGGMLIEAIHHINNEKLTYGRIYGQENNLSTSAIARMNLFLHGAKDFKIVQGDTLRFPKFLRAGKVKTFDCVIANPPFGLDKWGAKQFEVDPYGRNIWGTPSDASADFAWLQHMVCSMNPKTGKCAVIMPQGVLFHAGKEAEMRKQLVSSDKIECVITLVSGVFFSTGVNACILLLNNNKEKSHKNKICFIDASQIYTAKRAQNIMTQENIEEVYKLYKNYENVTEKCQIVEIGQIKDSLMPKMYIQKRETEKINPQAVKTKYLDACKRMLENEEKIKTLLKEGGYINE